jgi:CDP-diacylglycerol--glycerol-3-phosphate 3-phosphatidyltransferase
MPMNLPNILTILRLLAAPVVAFAFVLFSSPTADYLAFVLFVCAAITDFFDGYLARRWGQVSAFGRMLDPIADKVMVVIALALLVGLWQGSVWIVIPATLILFREVFVSGLREFLGADKDKLAVTGLAKWKTTAQMFAIGTLFLAGVFQDQLRALYYQMPPSTYEAILEGEALDQFGLLRTHILATWSAGAGITLLWIAAALTLLTGIDYFTKSLPYLKDDPQ